ncbi:mor transcription activator family protein [Mergibacter septicus]|uniref:Mor transcription activator family protein n=1 Tax=Mergibacter septicus TaxID=221402 RepID=UPI00117957D2|nr:Mor transcription activator family protein [Mergibacter septicus]AWX14257.1 mor transcription activator family protein [Mergibacter septicus]
MTNLECVSSLLPESVNQIIDTIGIADTEKLIKKFGGTTFRFSDDKTYFPHLTALLGVETATKLREVFNDEYLYIPRCETALRVLRNQKFRVEFNYLTQNEKISGRQAMLELCPKFGISDRLGWLILKQSDNVYIQNNLF